MSPQLIRGWNRNEADDYVRAIDCDRLPNGRSPVTCNCLTTCRNLLNPINGCS
ncbi:MAG: hypothetical protein AAGE59_14765 [Cyanobacteria bacterium P01_F01_bin.86]